MHVGTCYIQVPDVGPCACCGLDTNIAEASVAETWLCPGLCTDFYLAELAENVRAAPVLIDPEMDALVEHLQQRVKAMRRMST